MLGDQLILYILNILLHVLSTDDAHIRPHSIVHTLHETCLYFVFTYNLAVICTSFKRVTKYTVENISLHLEPSADKDRSPRFWRLARN